VNDSKLSRVDFAYFVSIRSIFVSYRCEDDLAMEHCCPNQFYR